MKLAKVDATVETELAEKHGVRGYPTLKFYRKGSAIDYGGGRQADDIVNWVIKKTGPAAKVLTTVEEAKSFIEAQNVAIVGFFKVSLTYYSIAMYLPEFYCFFIIDNIKLKSKMYIHI